MCDCSGPYDDYVIQAYLNTSLVHLIDGILLKKGTGIIHRIN